MKKTKLQWTELSRASPSPSSGCTCLAAMCDCLYDQPPQAFCLPHATAVRSATKPLRVSRTPRNRHECLQHPVAVVCAHAIRGRRVCSPSDTDHELIHD
ncbi:hypothetical protein AMTR_s00107p00121810 [Amborella trichopoda]|uniref:Uncharacterized protein n=1 Tax=Amborella trichopoda TaxID=13333 RepID=W1NT04_AMBTC|nr:hypothetical protein AMTR_s00107p00121810 [Amborella trichopoda]